MQTVDFILYARWIVPVVPSQTVLTDHAIVVHESRIVAILPADETKQQYSADTEHSFTDHCVIPGLINNHTHSAMSLFRGLADDLPLMTWLNEHIWPAEGKWVGDDFVEAGTQLAVAEMIRGGTTCFNDMYFFPEATAHAVEAAGMRACLGMTVIEFPTNWASDADEYLRKGQKLHDHYRHQPRITTAYAPHAPYTVSDSTLERIVINAEEMDLPIHMHIHETAAEITSSIEEHGVRPLERLKNLGLLSPRLIAVHMTQLTEQEKMWCADAGVHIAHCPDSNLKLASGFCPVADLVELGVNVTLGTDGAASNNDLDMFAEMRQAALLAKGVSGSATAVPAYQALEMATINGAKSLGLDEKIGSLEVGKQADFVTVDMSALETQPIFDVVSQLVYATGRHQVTDVWVAGQHILKQRQLATMNESHIRDNAAHWASKIGQADA